MDTHAHTQNETEKHKTIPNIRGYCFHSARWNSIFVLFYFLFCFQIFSRVFVVSLKPRREWCGIEKQLIYFLLFILDSCRRVNTNLYKYIVVDSRIWRNGKN